MIPRLSNEIEYLIPERSRLRIPRRDEVSEEGFGYFRDTWFIGRVRVADAREVMADERRFVETIDRLAPDPDTFEAIASALELADASRLPESVTCAFPEDIALFLADEDMSPLEGLEIGVAGLVFALSSVGCLTAASCRGHVGENTWSEMPVVFFAAKSQWVDILEGLARSSRCGLAYSEERAFPMLVVSGNSITDMMALADGIMENRKMFRHANVSGQHRTDATNSHPEHMQLTLGFDDQLPYNK